MADGYGGPVTMDVFCPQCGAVYSVTCKNPDDKLRYGTVNQYWIPRTAPTAMWEVLYKSNDNAVVPFDEWSDMTKIKFNCQVQDCKGVMECNRESFKKQKPTIPAKR